MPALRWRRILDTDGHGGGEAVRQDGLDCFFLSVLCDLCGQNLRWNGTGHLTADYAEGAEAEGQVF